MLLNTYMDSSSHNLTSRLSTMANKWVHFAASLIMAFVVMTTSVGLVRAQEETGSFVFCYQGEIEDHRLVIVDKQMQRTLVFMYVGDLVLVDEYPCGTGERQGNKTIAGDEKTPEGVYFITHRYLDNKVTIFGDRALHLDYPNAIDRLQGRMGDGIYIHGTNKKLKPRSSNGCVTLANGDLGRIGPVIRDQSTPVLILNHFQLPTHKERESACQFLQELRSNNMATGGESPGHDLALRQGKGIYKGAKTLAEKLAAFDENNIADVKTEVVGTALWRAGKQWVVLTNLKLSASKRQSVRALRRMYFTGDSPQTLALVRSQWLLDDIKSAKMLASWLPSHTTVASVAPVKAPPAADTAKPQAVEVSPEDQIKGMLQDWLAAWQNKKLKYYMSFYASDFKSDGLNKRAWQQKKAHLNKVYKNLKIHAKDIKISIDGDSATVIFTQYYKSDWHTDVGKKTMSLVKRKGRWQILGEEWTAMEPVQEAACNAPPNS